MYFTTAPEPDINDNDSVITSASSKYRPYLLPNTTTGDIHSFNVNCSTTCSD